MPDTIVPTEAIQIEAARSRWRHDLLMLDAAERRRVAGDDPESPVLQSLAAEAVAKEAAATIHLDHAEAIERFSIAKQARDADPKDERAARRYAEVRDALVAERQYWREVGEATGVRQGFVSGPNAIINDFPEPTDEDVLVSHGGNV